MRKQYLTAKFDPHTLVNVPSLTDNKHLAYLYECQSAAEMGLEQFKAVAPDLFTGREFTIEPWGEIGVKCVVTVADKPNRHAYQFSSAFEIPQEIWDLVDYRILADTSWGNDAMPSFEFTAYDVGSDKRETFRLWVDHPIKEERESGFENRFCLMRGTYEEAGEILTLTDNIKRIVNDILVLFFALSIASDVCPWPDCESSDIAARHDNGQIDAHLGTRNGTHEEAQCNECGREWTVIKSHDGDRVVIDQGRRQCSNEDCGQLDTYEAPLTLLQCTGGAAGATFLCPEDFKRHQEAPDEGAGTDTCLLCSKVKIGIQEYTFHNDPSRAVTIEGNKVVVEEGGQQVAELELSALQRAYLKSGGNLCLYCRSSDITSAGEFNSDTSCAWQNIRCDECGKEWRDLYTLQGVEPV